MEPSKVPSVKDGTFEVQTSLWRVPRYATIRRCVNSEVSFICTTVLAVPLCRFSYSLLMGLVQSAMFNRKAPTSEANAQLCLPDIGDTCAQERCLTPALSGLNSVACVGPWSTTSRIKGTLNCQLSRCRTVNT